MKLLKPLIIPLILIIGYLILISYPYFFSKINSYDRLGILSLVEEKGNDIKITGKVNSQLLKGEKITGELKSSEDNLGILLVRFLQLAPLVTDRVTFRIKEMGEGKWYYENTYNADQFQPNQYFAFGFPVIVNSKNKIYAFEVVSLAGTNKNGIGLSPKKPQLALVYKPTREDLLSVGKVEFMSKKFNFIAGNVNIWQYWPILISAFFIYYKIKEKNKVGKKKKDQVFVREFARQFASTRFYLVLLNNGTKKRFVIALFIFLFAFLYRFSATLVDQSSLYPFYPSLGNGVGVNSFYSLLGNGGDYDQFIRAATCAVKNFCPAILGQNFLIESSVLGGFYEIFGFVGGLRAYLYLMIILSSIVAALPYLILSRKNFFTVGGIIGSLYLSTSDYLTHMAINLPPDNGSLFIFSMFYIVYLLTIHIGTIRWLLFFGLVGIIDGLNKLTLLLNDLATFILFVPIFLYEKTKRIRKFPFVKLNLRIIFYSILPLLVFLLIYILWEYVVQIRFSTPYYLRGLIESSGTTYASSTDVSSLSLKESFSRGNVLEILFYYAGSTIVMLKRTVDYAGLNDISLTPILLGLLYMTFSHRAESAGLVGKLTLIKQKSKFIITQLISVVVFAAVALLTLELFRDNNLGAQDIGKYAYSWGSDIYLNIFLFASIIFLFILNFRYQAFKLSLPIVPYVLMLIILTRNAPWGRLWAHVFVWSIILFSFLIDWILTNTKNNNTLKRLFIGSSILILFISFYTVPKLSSMVGQFITGVNDIRGEVRYLKWVNSELPANSIILAGGKSDLVTLSQNIQKPIVYNILWTGALLIKPNEMPRLGTSDWHMVDELQSKKTFEKNKYLILDSDINLWRARLAGIGDNVFATTSASLLHYDNYLVEVYKFNSGLKRSIYELKFKENKDD